MDEISEVIEFDESMTEAVLGVCDENIRAVREHLHVSITTRGNAMTISGKTPAVSRALKVVRRFIDQIRSGRPVTANYMESLIGIEESGKGAELAELDIYPRTPGQERYIKAMSRHDLVFVTGPAGTGKTYLAVASAVQALKSRLVKKIVLVRPAVEAGEKLGFLPGDMQDKVNPYLIPVYDALYDMLGYDTTRTYIERNIIEVAPIAFMRGRTLHNAFIIMDEGQNTSVNQMLMFLTRMGLGSHVVVTGDVTQIDLPAGTPSGMLRAVQSLQGTKGIGFVELEPEDIVRHPLVREIVTRFEGDTQGRRA